MNTKFFVEVRVRNEEQQTRLYDHLQNDVLDSNSSDGTLDLDFERSFMKGLGSIVGSSYLSNKGGLAQQATQAYQHDKIVRKQENSSRFD